MQGMFKVGAREGRGGIQGPWDTRRQVKITFGRFCHVNVATRQCEKAWWISAMQTPTSPYHGVIDSMLLGKGQCMHMLLRLPMQGLLGLYERTYMYTESMEMLKSGRRWQ